MPEAVGVKTCVLFQADPTLAPKAKDLPGAGPVVQSGPHIAGRALYLRLPSVGRTEDLFMGVVVLRPRFVWGRDDTTALLALTDAVRSGKFAWISSVPT